MKDGIDFFRTLVGLRSRGWKVAVHNDYRIGGKDMTFWLMTHETGAFLKGEGETDMDALMEIDQQARAARRVKSSGGGVESRHTRRIDDPRPLERGTAE